MHTRTHAHTRAHTRAHAHLTPSSSRRSLEVGALVSKAICSLVHGLREPPAFLVAKGGITSNDVAVHALGVRRADVLGSVRPGVPVWRCGAESRAPGLAYVVFPGNVGAADDLARVAFILSGRGDEVWPPLPPGQAAAPATTLTAAAVAPPPAAAAAAAAVPAPVVYPRGEALLDTLRRARERGEAVGAFNVYNLEGVLAVRRAVELVGAPAIVQLHPASLTFGGTALVAACLDVSLGCSAAPMHVQLDHAEEEAAIRLALAAGVHGLMADGSGHEAASAARAGISELEANIAWTRRMAVLAHAEGAAVEAELGKLAGEEGGLELQLPPHCRLRSHTTPFPSPLPSPLTTQPPPSPGMEDGLAVEERDAKMTDPAAVARFLAETRAECPCAPRTLRPPCRPVARADPPPRAVAVQCAGSDHRQRARQVREAAAAARLGAARRGARRGGRDAPGAARRLRPARRYAAPRHPRGHLQV